MRSPEATRRSATTHSLPIVLLAFLIASAWGGIIYGEIETVVVLGDSAGAGLTFDDVRRDPRIQSSGRVVFFAWLDGDGVDSGNDGSWWGWTPGAGPLLLCREGDPLPAVGADVNHLCGGTFSPAADPGRLFMNDFLLGDSVTTGSDSAFVLNRSQGGAIVAAREGDPAPGTDAVFGHLGFIQQRLQAGKVAFTTSLTGGSAGSGVWVGPAAAVTNFALEGQPAPSVTGDWTFFSEVVFSPGGLVAFRASFAGGAGVSSPAGPSGEGIWAGVLAPNLVAASGDQAPGAGSASFSSFSTPSVSRQGTVVFEASLDNAFGGVWKTGDLGLDLVALAGAAAPGGGTFISFFPPVANFEGEVAFKAEYDEAPNDRTGIYATREGVLAAVVREGDPAPGISGASFANLRTNPILNRFDQVAFFALLSGDGVNATNDGSIWVAAMDGTLLLVAREGELLTVAPLDERIISELQLADGGNSPTLTAGTDDGGYLFFNDAGQLSFGAEFTDSSKGLFRGQPEATPYIFANGFESGETAAWSTTQD